MTTEAGLLDAIWHEPHDDGLRLIYADWLEEHGGEEERDRAELIRAQCELAHLPGDDPRYDVLEERAKEILARREAGWWEKLPDGYRKGHFERGFPVPDLNLSLGKLVRQDKKRLSAAPLWRYDRGFKGMDLAALFPWPFLHRLIAFTLRLPLPDGWPERVAACPTLLNVAYLDLAGYPMVASSLRPLLNAWTERKLALLSCNVLTADGIQILATHPAASGLRWLNLRGWGLHSDSLQPLRLASCLSGLVSLSFGSSNLRDAGLAHLFAWPAFGRLRDLRAASVGLTDIGAEQLAAAPCVANLRGLSLDGNQIGEAGALALADSPYLGRLRRLFLGFNPLRESQHAVSRLRERFGDAVTF